jgi:hypothetical protein
LLIVLLNSYIAIAQQRPLVVEPAEIIEPGHASAEFGFSHFRDQSFPLSGLKGDFTKIGAVRICVALSEFVELQTEGTFLDILKVNERKPAINSSITTTSDVTADIGDFSLWTKFAVLNEYRTGIGMSVRFGIQLPNASNESGLGIDEMNFFSSVLLQKHAAGRWTLNAGLGILGDPVKLGSQHDVFLYGIEYYLPVADDLSVLLQTTGRVGHSGVGIQRLANGKVGIEKTFGKLSMRLFGVSNFSPVDNAQGIELSFAYLIHVIHIR